MVIEVLDAVDQTAQPVDRLLRDWFRVRRYAGSKDRAAIAERAYAILRHRSTFAARMRDSSARSLVIASLLAEGLSVPEVVALFDGSNYGPAPLSDAECNALSSPVRAAAPVWVQGEFPQFLLPDLERAFGSTLLDEMLAMQERAPVDLRVNTLKASRGVVAEALEREGYMATAMHFAPDGLRLPPREGSARLSALTAFRDGLFEFQDEAAQIAARLCGITPGQRILDFAAGAGGKSLALAALMQNRGEIVAHDISADRLKPLAARAERAGATIIRPTHRAPDGVFDVVLIDSPCSGTGTWRRQPELRWRLTPARLRELQAIQQHLLEKGAGYVRPGGRLVYATCSVLPAENADRVAEFLGKHADFEVIPAAAIWGETSGPLLGSGPYFRASPRTTGTDGFFTAVLQRHSWTQRNALA